VHVRRAALVRRRRGADQHAVSARLVDRFHDELVDPLQHLVPLVGIGADERGHVREQRLLVEVEPDHRGHVRVDRLVVGDARADGVRKRHVARAVGVQETRDAERAVRPEGERVEVVVVDASVDDVDA
jgi:hypothetical protein